MFGTEEQRSNTLKAAATVAKYGSDPADQERQRVLRAVRADQLKGFSDSYRSVNFCNLNARDPATFQVMQQGLEAEVQRNLNNPTRMRGKLIPVESKDKLGRLTTQFFGDPQVWMAPFMGEGGVRRFGKINRPLFAEGQPIPGTLGMIRQEPAVRAA